MKIIGINGFKRSGKGETALAVEYLLRDQNVKSVGFADKLKILGAKTLGFTYISDGECITLMDEAKEHWTLGMHFGTSYEPFHHITGRQYLQNLGNEARSVFGEDFWIDQVLLNPANIDERDWSQNDDVTEYVAEQYPGVDVLCITDLRYENEARRIKDCGGVVWEVLRPGAESDGHASETQLPNELVDWQIFNDGDLSHLESLVGEALEETVAS